MPGWRRTVSAAAVLLALLPASAAGQSAGDEQYEDPFGEEQTQSQSTPEPAPAEPAPAQPAQEPAPSEAAPAPTAIAPAAPAPPQLPRTGWDAAVPGVLGLILLAAGVALRAHVRRAS